MVIYEDCGINPLGISLTRAYSDEGYYIERDGVEYIEAIDPTDAGRTYTETEHKIENEVTFEDYEEAMRALGVEI